MNTNTQAMMRFQNDVQGMANAMITQAYCAEKGIDYNQIILQAQAAQVQQIMQQEQMRQTQQVIANHYGASTQSNGLFGKIKDVFSTPNTQPAPNLFAMQGMAQPMMQPMTQPMMGAQPQDRVATLEQDMNNMKSDVTEIKAMISGLAQTLSGNQNIPLK